MIGPSDHKFIKLHFGNSTVPLGTRRWICNNDLLEDQDCSKGIYKFWSFWKTSRSEFNSVLYWWEKGKVRLKEIKHWQQAKARVCRIHKTDCEKPSKSFLSLEKQYVDNNYG